MDLSEIIVLTTNHRGGSIVNVQVKMLSHTCVASVSPNQSDAHMHSTLIT
jgi:hypothetical protein